MGAIIADTKMFYLLRLDALSAGIEDGSIESDAGEY